MRFVLTILFGVIGMIHPTFAQESIVSPDLVVRSLSTLTVIDGNPVAYYEIWYTNTTKDTVTIEKLEILDSKDLTVLDTYEQNELRERSRKYAGKQTSIDSLIAPGGVTVTYVEIETEMASVKRSLIHKLNVRSLATGSAVEITGATVPLKGITSLVIGPPLKEGPWAAVYLANWERGHRRVIYEPAGIATVPGRFAIDFVRMNEQGHYATRVEDSISNWLGYGMDVIAVADGIVASVIDTFSESLTLSTYQAHSSENATGNYISIRLSNGQYAFYEHLKPRSIKVKPGQRVKKGQVIGSVGFTGNTTGPHLHFHIANKNEALGGEGMPFLFEKFTLLGSYNNFENFGKAAWDPVNENSERKKERPAPNSVIGFYLKLKVIK